MKIYVFCVSVVAAVGTRFTRFPHGSQSLIFSLQLSRSIFSSLFVPPVFVAFLLPELASLLIC